ncbi:hypothetical protein Pan216_06210 [Planctomycetes bacterium Pan216]|uniref:Uncharacterized protein n=1 Tax=Kolteria novifilia TaxID=2527975 RepID=A0A518AYI3_9BACT|nr:hypothetical protein Pan216_06210 [Planctomycetes bacterium Pan216]
MMDKRLPPTRAERSRRGIVVALATACCVAFGAGFVASSQGAEPIWPTPTEPVPGQNRLWLKPNMGVYYPDAYFSRQYLRDVPVGPDQVILYSRLRPYENYGRFRLGVPVSGLTDGKIHSDRFPYRYDFGFQPVEAPSVPPRNICEDRRLAREAGR